MPYKSNAQRKKFHAMEERGEMSKKTVHEFDKESKGKKLPEHIKKHEEKKHEKKDSLHSYMDRRAHKKGLK